VLDTYTANQLAWAAVSLFFAFMCRGLSGFGAGLIATPLLALVLPMHVIVPLNSLLVAVLFVFLSIRDRREVVWSELKLLIVPTVAGVAAGLLLFKSLNNQVLLMLLGGFLIVYAAYTLAVHVFGLPKLTCSRLWSFPSAMSGAFIDTLFGGGGGTLVVIYLHARGLDKLRFRATVATLWLMEMVARLGGYSAAGFYRRDVLLLAVIMLPFIVAGTWFGERLGNRIRQETFSNVLAVMLLLAGITLVMR
jgi:uncharacterized membrane protein YfcA